MSASEPTEEQLRAAYEEQIKQVRVQHVLLEDIVMLVNLGMRRTGLMPGTESERDPEQVRLAIESVRALLPLMEAGIPEQAGQLRQALSQLQLAYVQIGGGSAPEDPGAAEPGPTAAAGEGGRPTSEPASTQPPPAKAGEPGPAQRTGRLWIPGQ